MSKRYGRNQKRAASKRIKELTQSAGRARKRVSELEFLCRRNAEIVEETAAILGNYFVTLPPSTVEIRCLDELNIGWRMPVQRGFNPRMGFFPDEDSATTFLEQVLPIIHGGWIADELRKHTHFRVEYQGEIAGYAIDDMSLRYLPDAETKIAKKISEFIMRNLCYRRAEGRHA